MYQRRDNFFNNKNKYLQNNQIACGVYFLYITEIPFPFTTRNYIIL